MLLEKEDKKILLEIAQKTLKESIEILAFGSRVNGNAHDCSDLDLVIRKLDNTKLNITELSNFKDVLMNSNIPFLVDVLDWGRIPQSFKDNINKQYEVLQ